MDGPAYLREVIGGSVRETGFLVRLVFSCEG